VKAPGAPFYVACASLAAWAVLAGARGGFWLARCDAHRIEGAPADETARVAVVVPARDEVETIGAAVTSLVGQRYAGEFAITLVDDGSTDGTAERARAAADATSRADRFAIVAGRPLRAPWTGKLNALQTGVADVVARRGEPDYWLFTDADIVHDPENVRALVSKARRDDLALVSLMVRLRCESPWERLLVPAFVFFFAKLYPFAWSNDPRRATAAAAGGCVLLRADALERIGGLQSIAGALIDDCALAAAVKRSGGATWLGLTATTTSVRPYATLATFWQMVRRSAFTQLRHSYLLTIAATAGMLLLYVAPVACTFVGVARRDVATLLLGATAWLGMTALYAPTLRSQRRPLRDAVGLPLAATLYMAMTLDSAFAHARGRGGAWKGRTYGGST
jgi:hopene-associated glycosyltransferase HpnB